MLDRDKQVTVKIIENNTGKMVYSDNYDYGKYQINLNDIYSLIPNTSYTIIATGTYVVNEDTSYTKNFLYKPFVTPSIGINIGKNGFTDTSLEFKARITDDLISEVKYAIYKDDKKVSPDYTIKNNADNKDEIFKIEGLTSNTKYKLKIYDIVYNGAKQQGDNWEFYYDCQTLKQKVKIEEANYSIDIRNAKFKLFLEGVNDPDESIVNYNYIMYKGISKTIDGREIIEQESTPIYTKETQAKEINVDVVNDTSEGEIVRRQYYYFKVVANCFDNEKYVEIGSDLKGPFRLDGKSFPTVKFEKVGDGVTATTINGNLQLHDIANTIVIDSDNPLTVIYADSVEEDKIYNVYKDTINMNVENGIYNIPIFLENLRANHTYKFYVYGTINLDNENENKPYVNALIGSVTLSTKQYETLKGDFEADTTDSSKGFEISLNLTSNAEESLDRLTSITFLLQAGANFSEEQSYKKLTITNDNAKIYAKKDTSITSLRDLLKDNNLAITPSSFGGNNSDYGQKIYTIIATMTFDNTKHKNKIPIETDGEEDTINTTFENGEYTAIGIVVTKKAASIGAAVTTTARQIKKSEAESYGIELSEEEKQNLEDNTIVGFKVMANNLNLTESDIVITAITFYVWDHTGTKAVTDSNGNQITKSVSAENGLLSSEWNTVFKVNRGTSDTLEKDLGQMKEEELIRGLNYRFSFKCEYIEKDEGMKSYPDDIKKHISYSAYSAPKQMPSVVMYPKSSNNDSMSFIYTCKDYDFALKQDKGKNTDEDEYYTRLKAYYYSESLNKWISVINGLNDGWMNINGNGEFLFENLNKGIYEIKCESLINKSTDTIYEQLCVRQRFDGVVSIPSDKIKYKASYDIEENPNKIKIDFVYVGNIPDLFLKEKDYLENYGNYMKRVAGAKISLTDSGTTETINKIYPIQKTGDDNPKYYVEVDLLQLSNATKLIGKDITVGLQVYMDNGQTGFDFEGMSTNVNDEKYFTFEYLEKNQDTEEITYGYLDKNLQKPDITQISNEKIFKDNSLTIENDIKILTMNGVKYHLDSTPNGLIYAGKAIIPKKIALQTMVAHTSQIQLSNIKVGIKLEKPEPTLTSVNIKAKLVLTSELAERIKAKNIMVKYCKVANAEDIVNWNTVNTKKDVNIADYLTIENNESQQFKIEIDELQTGQKYKLKFMYEDTSNNLLEMYNADPSWVGSDVFEIVVDTVADIGIDQESINISKNFKNYHEKYLAINYKISESTSNLYESTKYKFYRCDENGKKLPDEEPIIYEVMNDKTTKKEEIIHLLDVSPTNSISPTNKISPVDKKIVFGERYLVEITPTVESVNGRIDISTTEYIWEPTGVQGKTGLQGAIFHRKAIRINDNTEIELYVSFEDPDFVIIDGVYTINVYEEGKEESIYTNTKSITNINEKIYIKANATKSYQVIVTYEYDTDNNGSRKPGKEEIDIYALNDDNINLGEYERNFNSDKKQIEFKFENSHNLIEKVNSIKYEIVYKENKRKSRWNNW